MKRRALWVLPFLMLGAAGCTPMMWVKPGLTEAEFRRDRYECERDARQSGYFGQGLAGQLNMIEFAKQCMRARGYNEVPADATARNVR